VPTDPCPAVPADRRPMPTRPDPTRNWQNLPPRTAMAGRWLQRRVWSSDPARSAVARASISRSPP
jgi:hypothetical protein